MHMAVVAVAAPLLALAVAGQRVDPVRAMPRAASRRFRRRSSSSSSCGPGTRRRCITRRATQPCGLVARAGELPRRGRLLWIAALGGDARAAPRARRRRHRRAAVHVDAHDAARRAVRAGAVGRSTSTRREPASLRRSPTSSSAARSCCSSAARRISPAACGSPRSRCVPAITPSSAPVEAAIRMTTFMRVAAQRWDLVFVVVAALGLGGAATRTCGRRSCASP